MLAVKVVRLNRSSSRVLLVRGQEGCGLGLKAGGDHGGAKRRWSSLSGQKGPAVEVASIDGDRRPVPVFVSQGAALRPSNFLEVVIDAPTKVSCRVRPEGLPNAWAPKREDDGAFYHDFFGRRRFKGDGRGQPTLVFSRFRSRIAVHRITEL